MVAAENARPVKIHRKRMVVLRHLLTSVYDDRNILIGRVAHKFQGEVDLIRLTPINIAFLVLQIALQTLRKSGKLRPSADGNGQEGALHLHTDLWQNYEKTQETFLSVQNMK